MYNQIDSEIKIKLDDEEIDKIVKRNAILRRMTDENGNSYSFPMLTPLDEDYIPFYISQMETQLLDPKEFNRIMAKGWD